jgi:hypothetical protein
MAIRLSTAARNTLLDSGVNTMFDGQRLDIYSGVQPGTADTAPTGTLLATITLPADTFAAATGGSIAKNGTWSGTVTVAGTPGYYRLRKTSDLGTTNTTDIRIDGTVGTTGTDMIIDVSPFQLNGVFTVNTFTFSI